LPAMVFASAILLDKKAFKTQLKQSWTARI